MPAPAPTSPSAKVSDAAARAARACSLVTCRPRMSLRRASLHSMTRELTVPASRPMSSFRSSIYSTSAVDTATDRAIRDAFRNEMPDVTKIIIAQRISSVQDADRIIVMDNGRITDFGTHDELLNRCCIYREVYESQQKGGGDFDEQ